MTYRSRNVSKRKKKGIPALGVALVVLLVAAGGVGFYVLSSLDANAGTSPLTSPIASAIAQVKGTFYDGVFVDDIPLGGMTMAQARAKVEEQQNALAATISLELTHAKGNLMIGNTDVSYSFDTDAVLEQAFQLGRTGTKDEQNAAIEQMKTSPVKLTTKLTVDAFAVEQKVRDYAATLTVPGVNASFLGYDHEKPKGERLQFKPDTPGIQVNPDTLWAAVQDAFASKAFGQLAVVEEPLDAEVTVEMLQADLQLVEPLPFTGFNDKENARINKANEGHTYTSRIRNDSKQRRKNIELANNAINGTLLMPGEVLSVNEKTGERTRAKGYQEAPVDQNGIEDVGLGGGVCQVSSALYNAAIAAGPHRTEIVDRDRHSLVSGYMPKGTDATVNYPNKDFKFKNITDKPMLILMYYEKGFDGAYYEHADIYCVPDPEGAKYKLYSDVVKTIPAKNSEPRKVASNAVKPGQTKLIPGHKGYVTDVYLLKVAKDGTETKTKLYTDTYPAGGPVLAYYVKDPKPTDTPSETPTPTLTPSPSPTKTPKASTPPAEESTPPAEESTPPAEESTPPVEEPPPTSEEPALG